MVLSETVAYSFLGLARGHRVILRLVPKHTKSPNFRLELSSTRALSEEPDWPPPRMIPRMNGLSVRTLKRLAVSVVQRRNGSFVPHD